MAAFAAAHLDGVSPLVAGGERTGRDLLSALAAEPAKAAYSTVVLSDLVSAGQWIALAAAGLVPYFCYIEPQICPQPLYFAVIALGASCASNRCASIRPKLCAIRSTQSWACSADGSCSSSRFLL